MFNRKLFIKNPSYTIPLENNIEPIDITNENIIDDVDIDKIKFDCKKNKILLTKNIDGKRIKKSLEELKEELKNLNLQT